MIVYVTDRCSPETAKQAHLCGGKKKKKGGLEDVCGVLRVPISDGR